jgi:hypothetical protein
MTCTPGFEEDGGNDNHHIYHWMFMDVGGKFTLPNRLRWAPDCGVVALDVWKIRARRRIVGKEGRCMDDMKVKKGGGEEDMSREMNELRKRRVGSHPPSQ